MLELLSPAGSPEAVVAAVQNYADAVYLGLGGFNARQGAKNFTDEEFLAAVKYCHERGCKVYVTLNTLCSDRELPEAERLANFVSNAGVDAVLVQDLGLAALLRATNPDLTLHASTQMSVHNLAGVFAAAELGMKRVVLARELSLEQIKFITARSPIEIEVFVHGALCFCYSGQCYMSSVIGRRSGNRGMCAQPCRMQYSLGRKSDEYPMSLKDSCLIEHLSELEEAGVACIKIEGRMKRPEYTAIVTGIYHRAISEHLPPTEREMKMLKAAFSRDGFTDGYLTGKKQDMFGIRGEPDRTAAAMFSEARKAYSSGEVRRVDVDFYVSARKGESIKLYANDDDGNKVSVFGPVPEIADKNQLSEKYLETQLYKTGGTPFRCRSVRASVDEGLFCSASVINALRRSVLDKLTAERGKESGRREGLVPAEPYNKLQGRPVLNFRVSELRQITPELAQLGPTVLYVPLVLAATAPEETLAPFISKETELCAVMPRIISDSEMKEVGRLLKKARENGFSTALAGNLGHIAIAKACGMNVRGDFGMNAYNGRTLKTISEAGLLSQTLSFELRLSQIRDMPKPIDTELLAYGRLPLMVSEQCLVTPGGCAGLKNKPEDEPCARPCAESRTMLSDRTGSAFPVIREFGCRNVILNSSKLFLGDKPQDFADLNLWGVSLLFTTETPRECVTIAKSYLGMNEYSPNGLTRGLYYRGVE